MFLDVIICHTDAPSSFRFRTLMAEARLQFFYELIYPPPQRTRGRKSAGLIKDFTPGYLKRRRIWIFLKRELDVKVAVI